MGRGGDILRAIIGAVVFWVFIWLFYVGIISVHGTANTTQISTVPSTAVSHHLKWFRKESHHIRQDFNINYVSKRRVPNGPDPIHNRRASQSRQPTGRS